MQKEFINHLEKKLNLEILAFSQLYGGCINQAFKLETRSRNYFIKINSDSDLFTSASFIKFSIFIKELSK